MAMFAFAHSARKLHIFHIFGSATMLSFTVQLMRKVKVKEGRLKLENPITVLLHYLPLA